MFLLACLSQCFVILVFFEDFSHLFLHYTLYGFIKKFTISACDFLTQCNCASKIVSFCRIQSLPDLVVSIRISQLLHLCYSDGLYMDYRAPSLCIVSECSLNNTLGLHLASWDCLTDLIPIRLNPILESMYTCFFVIRWLSDQ